MATYAFTQDNLSITVNNATLNNRFDYSVDFGDYTSGVITRQEDGNKWNIIKNNLPIINFIAGTNTFKLIFETNKEVILTESAVKQLIENIKLNDLSYTTGSWNDLTFTITPKNGKNEDDTSKKLTFTLPNNYGDTKNPYDSKTKNYVLAAPSTANGAPTFRALVSSDIPSLGNLTSQGKITTTTPIANGDRLVIVDSDTTADSKITGSSITFDGSTTSKALTPKGTWETFNNYSLPLAANGTRGGIQIGYTESGNNYAVKLSSEKAYVTVSNMTGAKSNEDGKQGLVPYPSKNDTIKFLRGDGTWHQPYNSVLSNIQLSFASTATTATATVTGVTASNTVIVSPVAIIAEGETVSSWEIWRDAGIRCVGQTTDTLSFKADETPVADTYFNVIILD